MQPKRGSGKCHQPHCWRCTLLGLSPTPLNGTAWYLAVSYNHIILNATYNSRVGVRYVKITMLRRTLLCSHYISRATMSDRFATEYITIYTTGTVHSCRAQIELDVYLLLFGQHWYTNCTRWGQDETLWHPCMFSRCEDDWPSITTMNFPYENNTVISVIQGFFFWGDAGVRVPLNILWI
jgi:hypothetical protein